jgi:hypothetical protein
MDFTLPYPPRAAVFFVTSGWQPPAPEQAWRPWVGECASRFLTVGPRVFAEFDPHDVQAIVAVAGQFDRILTIGWVVQSWSTW